MRRLLPDWVGSNHIWFPAPLFVPFRGRLDELASRRMCPVYKPRKYMLMLPLFSSYGYRKLAGGPKGRRSAVYAAAPWHFLYFLPEPHGQGSFRPTFAPERTGLGASA